MEQEQNQNDPCELPANPPLKGSGDLQEQSPPKTPTFFCEDATQTPQHNKYNKTTSPHTLIAKSPYQPGSLGMFTQPFVQDIAFQYGKQLVGTSSQVFREGITRYLPLRKLKYYFAVDTNYVMAKLQLIIFPFQQKDWSLKYESDGPVQPRFELNAPDLYIPAMAYITYILMASLALGTQNRFTPEHIGLTASSAIAIWILELMAHFLLLYVMQIEMTMHIFDLLAYSGYKFVGIILSIFLIMIGGKSLYFGGLFYTNFVLAFFLVRSLKGPVLANCTDHRKRVYYLLVVAGTQPFWSWWLTYHLLPIL